MADVVVDLVNTKNERVKRLVIPMPEGFRWEAETTQVTDFAAKGEIFLVAGVQISARNNDAD
jgi:hypothetical protein